MLIHGFWKMMADTKSPLIIALDFTQKNQALSLADKLDSSQCRLKIGKEMFTRFGPELVRELQQKGFDIFLDLKFHDIPNTVAKACIAAADLGVWMLNVHASGGRKMMEAAKGSLEDYGKDAPLLIAVTVLTSMSENDMRETAIDCSIEERVITLAKLTEDSGLAGIVCSALEAPALRKVVNHKFLLITPGIRPLGSAAADQHRIMTPIDAISAGADYLVIGRPVTQSGDPLKMMCEIADSMGSAIQAPS